MAQLKSGTTIGGNTAYHSGNLPSFEIGDGEVTSAKLATGTNERDWVLARTAGASVGAVGTYAVGWNSTTSNIARGSTISGSSIRVTSASANGSNGPALVFGIMRSESGPSFPTSSTTTLAGTWRAMTYCRGRYRLEGSTHFWYSALWLRIA